ncbi:MAG: cob(I)yrinic acid a,c-diamide adenosyltransferase, partial [Candidatus Hodarchaeota archaeon]
TQNDDKEIKELISKIQWRLFELASGIATPLEKEAFVSRIDEGCVLFLEKQIDHFQESLPPLKNFIIPGGTVGASSIHMARTVCRRAERLIVRLMNEEKINPHALKYINRLADLLFVLARVACYRSQCPEAIWSKDHLLERE